MIRKLLTIIIISYLVYYCSNNEVLNTDRINNFIAQVYNYKDSKYKDTNISTTTSPASYINTTSATKNGYLNDRINILAKSFAMYDNVYLYKSTVEIDFSTKDYYAALLSLFFNSLPDNVYNKSEYDFMYYLAFNHFQITNFKEIVGSDIPQFYDIKKLQDNISKIKICASYNYCDNTSNSIPDLAFLGTLIHEYAHYIDRTVNRQKINQSELSYPNSFATIDTIDFYKISYNVTDEYIKGLENFNPYLSIKNGIDINKDFVSLYASGFSYTKDNINFAPQEDFAESFAMYVMNGIGFRSLAKNNVVLKSKYEWLKTNVFKSREYYTGNEAIKTTRPYVTSEYLDNIPIDFIIKYTN